MFKNFLAGRFLLCLIPLASLRAATNQPGNTKWPGPWNTEGVIYLDHSLNARLYPVPISAVQMGEGFWAARRKLAAEHSLPATLQLLEEHGLVDNFRRLSGRPEIQRRGPIYSDSDLYKWIEGAAWAVASNETSDSTRQMLRGDIDSLVNTIVAAQDPNGYLDTYFSGDRAHLRFTDLIHSHEDYCLGLLLQAGIAYYRATGNRRLLEAGIRFADFVVQNFGPSNRPFVTGHPELEMALVELFRTTGDAHYLEFARYLLSGVERDRLKLKDGDIRFMFSGKPFTSRTEFEGNAMRALYAAAGATDFFTETGDPAYKHTLDILWNNLTTKKMYLTGSAGSRAGGEFFGDDYDLPNDPSVTESCTSSANTMWNFRLLMLSGDSRYADVMERALYNGVNAGLSLAGNVSCGRISTVTSASDRQRGAWLDSTCCPPGIERIFEALPGYVYATSRDGVYVNLFHDSILNWHLEDGTPLSLTQSTAYPWNNEVKLVLKPAKPSRFTLYLRWPNWAPTADLVMNGQALPVSGKRGTFIALTRVWNPGDSLTLTLGMQPSPTLANPRVADDFGRLALQRGPLVYALEQADQPGFALGDLFYKPGAAITLESHRDFLGGATVLKVPGLAAEKSLVDDPLYQPLNTSNSLKKGVVLTFIPYYALGNREASQTEVWVPVSRSDSAKPDNASALNLPAVLDGTRQGIHNP